MTPFEDIQAQIDSGSWLKLQANALSEISKAEKSSGSTMNPLLGGGTRLMLDLKHRVSDDIDLFINSPQWIGYLSPRLTDRFDNGLNHYEEGGATLKLFYKEGEIDFICCLSLTTFPPSAHAKTPFLCEDPYEVLAKKLFHRGHVLAPRDLFDWRALVEIAPDDDKERQVLEICNSKLGAILTALEHLAESSSATQGWDKIQTHLNYDFAESIEFARERILNKNTCRPPGG